MTCLRSQGQRGADLGAGISNQDQSLCFPPLSHLVPLEGPQKGRWDKPRSLQVVPPRWYDVVHFLLPWGPASPQGTYVLVSESALPSGRRWLPHPPLTCHSRRWPQSCWKWCRVRLCPFWGWGIWLKSLSPGGGHGPQHAHPPCPGTAPLIYPKTPQQLLTGPEPNLSRGPGVGPGCRKQTKPSTSCELAVITSAGDCRYPLPLSSRQQLRLREPSDRRELAEPTCEPRQGDSKSPRGSNAPCLPSRKGVLLSGVASVLPQAPHVGRRCQAESRAPVT